jgi:uncharacterized membrane protein YfcA
MGFDIALALLGLHLPPREAVTLSVLGALGAYRQLDGEVPWRAALALTLGSLIGGVVGVAAVDHLPAVALRRLIGIMTVLAGVALLLPWRQ